jgi:hypothetical protein
MNEVSERGRKWGVGRKGGYRLEETDGEWGMEANESGGGREKGGGGVKGASKSLYQKLKLRSSEHLILFKILLRIKI